MDCAGANLIEPGDDALVINTGYFSDRFADILERYGARVTHVRSPVGDCPELDEVETELSKRHYKLITVTHVDTSTGVLADVKGVATLAKKHGSLLVVDGVCSVAGEELRMSEWGIDVTLTASQKAVGVPPGLALLVIGQHALKVFKSRKTPVMSYYTDWTNWLPVMSAYEERKPAYFGTPAINLVFALNISLGQILAEGLEARWRRHIALSQACKAAMSAIGLNQVPVRSEAAAHTMTALRFPRGVVGPEFLPRVTKAGAILAGGLHPAIRSEYFRIGHMGATQIGDVLATVGAVETALEECGYNFEHGIGVQAAQVGYRLALQGEFIHD
jgi:alanine-glyoxylate transaminase/serine-glyoxylate transaminase/serine-pyruvate transaminase